MHVVLAEIIGWEILLVLAVIALLFGSSQIPKLARSIGQTASELRKGMHEGADPGGDESTPKSDGTNHKS